RTLDAEQVQPRTAHQHELPDRVDVWLVMRAHVDQQAIEELDTQILERARLDDPLVLLGREPVDVFIGGEGAGCRGDGHRDIVPRGPYRDEACPSRPGVASLAAASGCWPASGGCACRC